MRHVLEQAARIVDFIQAVLKGALRIDPAKIDILPKRF